MGGGRDVEAGQAVGPAVGGEGVAVDQPVRRDLLEGTIDATLRGAGNHQHRRAENVGAETECQFSFRLIRVVRQGDVPGFVPLHRFRDAG